MAPKRKCMTNPSARHVPRQLEEAPGEEGLRIAYGGVPFLRAVCEKPRLDFAFCMNGGHLRAIWRVKVMTSLVEKDDSPAKMITAEILT